MQQRHLRRAATTRIDDHIGPESDDTVLTAARTPLALETGTGAMGIEMLLRKAIQPPAEIQIGLHCQKELFLTGSRKTGNGFLELLKGVPLLQLIFVHYDFRPKRHNMVRRQISTRLPGFLLQQLQKG